MQLATGQKLEPKKSRFSLDSIKKGKRSKPQRIVLYGQEGVGKTTLAAKAPDVTFLDFEEGASEFDISYFPEPPETFAEVLEAVRTLRNDKKHKFLVVDTIDRVERLIHSQVCHENQVKSIADIGWQNGYKMALEPWREFMIELDAMSKASGMHVILLAHCSVLTFKNPQGPDFDRYQMHIDHRAAALIRQWSDAMLFAQYETLSVKEDKKDRKGKGVSTSAVRQLHSERTDAYDAKNRFGMPPTMPMPLDWDDFWRHIEAGEPDEPDAIIARCNQLIGFLPENQQEKAMASLKAQGQDARKLSQLENYLKGKVQ